MLEEKIPEELYHYTTIKTLPFMFKGEGKVEFRFTDYRFLNDAEEGIFLKKFIEKNRDEYCDSLLRIDAKKLFNKYADLVVGTTEFLRGENVATCIMSFSKCRDSMQFWRQDYAKDKGICLKLNTSKFRFPTIYDDAYPGAPPCPTFSQVKYIEAKNTIENALPELKNDISDFLKSKGEDAFDDLVFLTEFPQRLQNFNVKNKVWESEKEWRLKIRCLGDDSSLFGIKAKYVIDDLGIPRASINIENPIDEIILGPSFTPQYVDSIKMWLRKRGYEDVDVHCGDGVLNG